MHPCFACGLSSSQSHLCLCNVSAFGPDFREDSQLQGASHHIYHLNLLICEEFFNQLQLGEFAALFISVRCSPHHQPITKRNVEGSDTSHIRHLKNQTSRARKSSVILIQVVYGWKSALLKGKGYVTYRSHRVVLVSYVSGRILDGVSLA